MGKYFEGSGAEYLDAEFEKLLGVLSETSKPTMPNMHAKAGAVGGLYFLIEFAKVNHINTLPLANQMLSMGETNVRNLFEQLWAHQDRKISRMKGRFLCDISVGYNHMLDLYQKKYPDVNMPGRMTVNEDQTPKNQCKTGKDLFKTVTRRIPAPPSQPGQ